MPGCERGGRGVCRGRLVHVLRRKVLFDGGKQEQGIRQVSDNPAFASVSPIRKPARICP